MFPVVIDSNFETSRGKLKLIPFSTCKEMKVHRSAPIGRASAPHCLELGVVKESHVSSILGRMSVRNSLQKVKLQLLGSGKKKAVPLWEGFSKGHGFGDKGGNGSRNISSPISGTLS